MYQFWHTLLHKKANKTFVQMPTFLVCRILLQKFSNSFLEFILFDVNILSKCISATLTAHLNIDTVKQLSSNNKFVRCQTKVHNCKCSYLLWYFLVLLSKILFLIEFCFIISLIFLIFSPCPKYTSLGVRLSNYSWNLDFSWFD